MSAAKRWADDLASWAIPPEILGQAEDDPWRLPVAPFARAAVSDDDTPSRARAREALPSGGIILDVGCGAGAAGFAVADAAGLIVGFDESADMLDAFTRIAAERGIASTAIQGRWPEADADAPIADVVVCHHVLYNVAEIEPFVRALDRHARRRVVVEVTAEHPRAWMHPYWERFWGLRRPGRPTAGDLIEVLDEMGVRAERTSWSIEAGEVDRDEIVEMLRRHLCLPAARTWEVADAFDEIGRPEARELATFWWDPAR